MFGDLDDQGRRCPTTAAFSAFITPDSDSLSSSCTMLVGAEVDEQALVLTMGGPATQAFAQAGLFKLNRQALVACGEGQVVGCAQRPIGRPADEALVGHHQAVLEPDDGLVAGW